MEEQFRMAMLKQGMVGNVQRLNFKNIVLERLGLEGSVSVMSAYYGIDTHLTVGGSGGPVVNRDGEVIGIVLKRTRTDLETDFFRLVPSETGLAVSHHMISWVLDYSEQISDRLE
jgi:S1-C subfamily serine protease